MPVKPSFIPKILIIDDEPFNLEFLEVILRQHGYITITANNGKSGRRQAETQNPDLILLDIMMPGETGFECAAALRLSPDTCEIPIIFLTALDDPQSTSKGYDAGAVDFIVKPFEYKDVLQRIKTHLQIAESEKRFLKPSYSDEKRTPDQTGCFKTNTAFYPAEKNESEIFIHESVNLSERSEGHILLNFSAPVTHPGLYNIVSNLLANNSGPLFTPSTVVRNLGIELKKVLNKKVSLSGIYAEVNRDNNQFTVVNSGALPVIHQQKGKAPVLIERQSDEMGSLGLGLPPCKTLSMGKGDRLFMFSNGMIEAFPSAGSAIIELSEACELSARVDLETACLAVGEMLQKGGREPDGILIGIEA